MPSTTPRSPAVLTLDTPIKFLCGDGTGPYSGYAWPLPDGDTPGAWVAVEGDIILCHRGLHYTTLRHWRPWVNARALLIETDGEIVHGDDKSVCRRARLVREIAAWDERTLRLFAADCAEAVLPLFERDHPADDRPRRAIEAARRYARGEIGAAASPAAFSAARTAARIAAAAASPAAFSAARTAARIAVRTAAAAASAAAFSDASAAARTAARTAAESAARTAAGADASAAARTAAEAGQDARLLAYLNGEVPR